MCCSAAVISRRRSATSKPQSGWHGRLDMAKAVKTKKKTKTYRFDAAKTLDTPEAIAEYLTAAFETADASFIARAIGTAARAKGMATVASAAGLSRENLYRSFNGKTDR